MCRADPYWAAPRSACSAEQPVTLTICMGSRNNLKQCTKEVVGHIHCLCCCVVVLPAFPHARFSSFRNSACNHAAYGICQPIDNYDGLYRLWKIAGAAMGTWHTRCACL